MWSLYFGSIRTLKCYVSLFSLKRFFFFCCCCCSFQLMQCVWYIIFHLHSFHEQFSQAQEWLLVTVTVITLARYYRGCIYIPSHYHVTNITLFSGCKVFFSCTVFDRASKHWYYLKTCELKTNGCTGVFFCWWQCPNISVVYGLHRLNYCAGWTAPTGL